MPASGEIAISNNSVGLVLDAGAGYLKRIEATDGRLQIHMLGQQLWRVTLRDSAGRGVPTTSFALPRDYPFPQGTREIVITNTNAGPVVIDRRREANDQLTLLHWRNLDVGPDRGVLDVTVTIRAISGDPLLRWRIAVRNRSKTFGIWSVEFPRLNLLPINATPEDDYLAIPRFHGVAIRNPFHHPSKGLGVGGDDGLWNPGKYTMQFAAFYEQDHPGLYLACYDGDGWRRAFRFGRSDDMQSIYYGVTHYPTDMGVPAKDFTLAYDCIMGVHDDGWFGASKLYRKWALKQKWMAAGPVEQRNDIPEWFKKSPLQFVEYSKWKGVRGVANSTKRYVQRLGRHPYILTWYDWQHFDNATSLWGEREPGSGVPDSANVHDGEYFPAREGFAQEIKALRAMDVYPQIFVAARIYDPGNPQFKTVKRYMCMDVNGRRRVHSTAWPGYDTCVANQWWPRHISGIAQTLVRDYGSKAIYFDTFGVGQHFCFDTRHGHSRGGGTFMAENTRQLGHSLWKAIQQADPQAAATGENVGEYFLGAIGGDLVYPNYRPQAVPMKKAVYGGYWLPVVGEQFNCGKKGPIDPMTFRISVAWPFIHGYKIGRIRVDADGILNRSDMNDELDYLKKLLEYLVEQRRYLVFGELMRPPTLHGKIALLKIPDYNKPTISRNIPAVWCSSWKASDGTVAVFLTNISDETVTLQYSVDPDQYFDDYTADTYVLERLGDQDKYGQTLLKAKALQVDVEIAPLEVLIHRYRPHNI